MGVSSPDQYSNSEVCYAYLQDVPEPPSDMTKDWLHKEFTNARWFTRGWTLREMIAPRKLEFFSRGWCPIRSTSPFKRILEQRTRVPARVFGNQVSLQNMSIAQRMSWASERETTRAEDMAYCLMGLFNINMPMLYGEGDRAFIRLQEGIIKNSDDMSIFAWVTPMSKFSALSGLLASSPKLFATTGHVKWRANNNPPHEITNKGIKLPLKIVPR
ncbi:hypothetical protein B0T16DRAFT_494862 [Cercophora newfieldiana]|uniref:DUF8212 domain-containing protein n=1 Tax=Cercophora newfieldiana TaxID=92897 RepID=A0AA40CMJ8_9PEZI|nr:hypothetical protein B0T16DRAFT_494862 [Cercophora newfieldiana]